MKTLGTVLAVTGLVALGCAGQPARGQTSSTTSSTPTSTSTTTTTGTTTSTSGVVANTGTITAPNLVSANFANVLAYVPTRTGASYAWSISNGSIPGITKNAAVYFNAGAAGTTTLTCAVTTSDGVTTTYSQDVPVVAPMALTTAYYGSGMSADSLANTVIGGPSGNVVDYRFQARYSSPLQAIRVFFIWSSMKAGYNAGLGGTVQVDLLADDGSPAHLPTGASLASTSYGNIISGNNYYPKLSFPNPVALTGGSLYHLVFTNIDADPVNNYVSLDSLYTNQYTAPMQPVIPDYAWAVLYRYGANGWRLRQGYTPTLELDYAAGSHGTGYMEVWSTNPKTISGANAVRQTFKVSGPSRSFSKVNVRVERMDGTSPLTVRVEEGDGTLVDSVDIPASAILQDVATWVVARFPVAHTLNTGVAYHLVLSSPADTSYAAYPIRKGLDKGFSPYTVFPDGYAQFTTRGDAGWTGWDMWGTPNLTFSDLQFAFLP